MLIRKDEQMSSMKRGHRSAVAERLSIEDGDPVS